jgi:hypothetical protein
MTVSKKFIAIACLFIVAGLLTSTVFAAADANKPKKERPGMDMVKGTVAVTKDANGISAIKITTKDNMVYNVMMDEKGKELAKHDGKEVGVHGVITKKNTENWITVKHIMEPGKDKNKGY